MNEARSLRDQILNAFRDAPYPGDENLRGSDEGDEPYLLEEEFKGRTDWRLLDARFIDQAPNGFGTALSFFSSEAFRFYLPAYLVADIEDALTQSDPAFHLCHGLDNESKDKHVNPRLYGDQTWIELKRLQFAVFSEQEVSAIVAYLHYTLGSTKLVDIEAKSVREALQNYWLERAGQSAS